MAVIQGFRIKNFKVLHDIVLGKLWSTQQTTPLTSLTAVIGKNGSGKSTILDAFGFLADCLKSGVEEACELHGRGGFEKLRSQGKTGPIEFEVYYKEDKSNSRPITYELAIDLDRSERPFVQSERLRQRRKGQSDGQPFSFLNLENGTGRAWKGTEAIDDTEESNETEIVELEDKRKLGIATLGTLKQHPRIVAFRKFIESWYLSYFTPDAARGLPFSGAQRHLNIHGDNLSNVVQFIVGNPRN